MASQTRRTVLEDTALLSEIELLTDLIIAATHSPGMLDQTTIDAALGLTGASA